jgi:hypothetical protein
MVYPDHRIAIEIQGGIWVKSHHTSGKGIQRDCEKLNLCVLAGYHPLLITSDMIDDLRAVDRIKELMNIIDIRES